VGRAQIRLRLGVLLVNLGTVDLGEELPLLYGRADVGVPSIFKYPLVRA
jgi:hypothetical protein